MLYKAGKYKYSLFNPKNVSYCHTIEPIYKIESPKKASPQKLPIRRIGTKKCETELRAAHLQIMDEPTAATDRSVAA